MTTVPRYSVLRHRLLAEIAAGRMRTYQSPTTPWTLLRQGHYLQRGEVAAAESLRALTRPAGRYSPARLTDEGQALLDAWTARWGNPLVAEGARNG